MLSNFQTARVKPNPHYLSTKNSDLIMSYIPCLYESGNVIHSCLYDSVWHVTSHVYLGPDNHFRCVDLGPRVLMDNDNDNHLFLHLSPESRILSAQKWQKSLMKPGRARRIMKPFLTRQGLDVSSSRENSNIKICIIGSNCLMQTTQKISKHIKTNELFEQLQSRCDNPLLYFL